MHDPGGVADVDDEPALTRGPQAGRRFLELCFLGHAPPLVALIALIAVTAVWGVTFVQVKDAVEVYPLFAFLAVRYAIAAGALGLAGAPRVRTLGRSGLTAGAVVGVLGALGSRRTRNFGGRDRAVSHPGNDL